MDCLILRLFRHSANVVCHTMINSLIKAVKNYNLHTKINAILPSSILRGVNSSAIASKTSDSENEVVDFLFTPEHYRMRDSLLKLIEKDINPHVDEWEKAKQFPAHEVFKKLGRAGFLGVNKPAEYGGLGLDASYAAAVAEELGSINCGGIPMAIGVQADMATPALANFGSDELKKQFLAPSIAGDLVACVGISEPQAGSDVSFIKTNARRSGDDYIINGQKMWITNGCQADWICLLVNTSNDGGPHRNKSLICVPLNSKGVSRTKIEDKLGMHSSDTAQMFFDDVRVPARYLIGEENMGFVYQMLQFQNERIWGVAGVLKALEKCIQSTIEYAGQRKIFGQTVLDFQVVHFRMAELQTEVEALRALLYRTVGRAVNGEDVTKLASMAKLKAGRLAREVTDSCIQYFGGMGFTESCHVTRIHRDLRLLSIGAGADEVMLSIICKYMGTLPQQKSAKKSIA